MVSVTSAGYGAPIIEVAWTAWASVTDGCFIQSHSADRIAFGAFGHLGTTQLTRDIAGVTSIRAKVDVAIRTGAGHALQHSETTDPAAGTRCS
jgi:hypothetical protein